MRGGLESGIFRVHYLMAKSPTEGGGVREFQKLITADDQQNYAYCPGGHEEN
jgi:hypothetical protein